MNPLTHFYDLSQCDYFGAETTDRLRAIGWLAAGHNYTTGETDESTFSKLKELLRDPWQPTLTCGLHECELCQFDRPTGHANLFVPAGTSLFICPELIVHYIAAHKYRPPDEFLRAVICCPSTRTIEYKKQFLQSGGGSLVQRSGQ